MLSIRYNKSEKKSNISDHKSVLQLEKKVNKSAWLTKKVNR
jgi:hypothetical protein